MTRARDLADSADKDISGTLTLDGLVVDDITIDGSTISDGGDLTLDVAGDLILDSDAPNWRFKDNGTSILEIGADSQNPVIYAAVADKDIQFKGNDGGSTITALTLDMSAAGDATFNNNVKAGNSVGVSGSAGMPVLQQAAASASFPSYSFYDDGNTGMFRPSADALAFATGGSERFRISSGGVVQVNGSGYTGGKFGVLAGAVNSEIASFSGSAHGGGLKIKTASTTRDDDTVIFNASDAFGEIAFHSDNTEVMRITKDNNLLVGTTSMTASDTSGTGMMYANGIALRVKRESNGNGQPCLDLNNTGSDDVMAMFRKDGVTVGSIGSVSGTDLFISGNRGTNSAGIKFTDQELFPVTKTGATQDNAIDIGHSAARFDDIYATNGTIQTSDRNEKQDIAELTDAEQRVAVAAKGLLRKFRWKTAVAEKGDEARTHFGIIAQDLQAAFAAEGLDAGDYAMFISSTWTDEETGEERTRMGVRYSELLAFIIAAI